MIVWIEMLRKTKCKKSGSARGKKTPMKPKKKYENGKKKKKVRR